MVFRKSFDFIRFYPVLSGFIGFYWVLSGFIGFLFGVIQCYSVLYGFASVQRQLGPLHEVSARFPVPKVEDVQVEKGPAPEVF